MGRPCSHIAWDEVPFGILSDGELARELEVSATTIRRQRQKRGIAPHDKGWFSTKPRRYPWNRCPLGQLPDREIAQALGAHRTAVLAARRKRGVDKFVDHDDPDALARAREQLMQIATTWREEPPAPAEEERKENGDET